MKNKLKAFVRVDITGNIVPSSVILQVNRPKVGKWKEIGSSLCCNQTTTSTTTTTTTAFPGYSIGDHVLGGIVAYILQPGDIGYDPLIQHGIISAIINIQFFLYWGCSGTSIPGADGTLIGTGPQNTLDIVTNCSEEYTAAKYCNDYVSEGYSDWYLPSKEELTQLYINRNIIGNFNEHKYWSSSENTSTTAWVQDFFTGEIGTNPKNNTLPRIRAIRSF